MKRTAENDEFLRKRKARQRKIRKRRIRIGLVLFLILLIAVGAVLSLTVLFPIETLNAGGSKKYSPEQIAAASGIKTGDNLFTASVNTDELRKKLPYIERVKIKRELPGKLTLTVTDAAEYAAYNLDGKFFTVSKSGYVLNASDQKPEGVLEIRAAGVKCTPGTAVAFSSEKTEKQIQEITGSASGHGVSLDYIDLTDELALTVKAEGRFLVNLGTANNLENKFAHLSGMVKNIGETKTGKINLSMWTSGNTEGTFVEGSIE